jgi:hypothetical protein
MGIFLQIRLYININSRPTRPNDWFSHISIFKHVRPPPFWAAEVLVDVLKFAVDVDKRKQLAGADNMVAGVKLDVTIQDFCRALLADGSSDLGSTEDLHKKIGRVLYQVGYAQPGSEKMVCEK